MAAVCRMFRAWTVRAYKLELFIERLIILGSAKERVKTKGKGCESNGSWEGSYRPAVCN